MSSTSTSGPSSPLPETSGRRSAEVRRIAESRARERGPLLEILRDVVAQLGWVSRDDETVVADVLNLSRADVRGVVSFYADLHTEPRPTKVLQVCRAEACRSLGAQDVYDHAQARLADHEDAMVEQVFCLGNCALGPSGLLDGRLLARLDAQAIDTITEGWS